VTLFATERLPTPLTISAAVTNDVATRTLIVRRPETASGYERLLWREAHQALTRAEDSGWRTAHPYVWGGAFGDSQIVHGSPGENLTLLFHFPVGESAYAKLVGRPGLYGLATMDRALRRFMGCKFLHRGV
jgi:hypothetical protein